MNNDRIAELRSELDAERIDLSELAEIEAAFADVPDDVLWDVRENAMAGDMLDVLEAANSRLLPACIEPEVVHGEVVEPVEVIGPVNPDNPVASQILVKRGDDYFVVSSVVASFSGFETLIFPADSDGNITSYTEVGGGRGVDSKQAIADLEKYGPYCYDDNDEED